MNAETNQSYASKVSALSHLLLGKGDNRMSRRGQKEHYGLCFKIKNPTISQQGG